MHRARQICASELLSRDEKRALIAMTELSIASVARHVSGRTTVLYKCNGTGRFTAHPQHPPNRVRTDKRTLTSLTQVRPACYMHGMCREVRAWLAYKYYHDIDMANAQPTLCLQLFQKNGIDAPCLQEYTVNRAKHLASIMEAAGSHNNNTAILSRDVAKELFIRVMFGGTVDKWRQDHRAFISPHMRRAGPGILQLTLRVVRYITTSRSG